MRREHWPLKFAFGVMALLISISEYASSSGGTSAAVLLVLGILLALEALSDRELHDREMEWEREERTKQAEKDKLERDLRRAAQTTESEPFAQVDRSDTDFRQSPLFPLEKSEAAKKLRHQTLAKLQRISDDIVELDIALASGTITQEERAEKTQRRDTSWVAYEFLREQIKFNLPSRFGSTKVFR